MMHGEKISICKFFTKNQHCPYEEIGCKFSHEHKPSENANNNEDLDNDDEVCDESYELNENQCHLCKLQMLNRDDFYKHVETEHPEYHQGMMEIVENMRNNMEPVESVSSAQSLA